MYLVSFKWKKGYVHAEEQLKRMVMTFRVSELQMLLGYAGKNKTGRKNELQGRALDVVKMRNNTVQQKIRELYKSIQLEMMSFGDRAQAAAGGGPPIIMPNQRVPSGMVPSGNPAAGYGQQASAVAGGLANQGGGYSSRSSSGQVPPQSGSLSGYSMQSSLGSNYPISPDVKLKNLPFYDIMGELLKPSTLAPQGSGRYQEGTFTFSLTPHQANRIALSRDIRPGRQDYAVQVQMRFCLLETTCEQEDNFPPNITVKINDKLQQLPNPIPTNKAGVEPKRPPKPVNVTALCRISPTVTNRILVSWASEYGRAYVISVYLVQKLTSEDLLQRLKTKGPRLADFTKSLIKQKLKEDSECEIATTSLRCSLLCPLGKMRMALPCRSETCNHLQCFDASLFLQMNERKPTWQCPVCDKQAIYDNLVIDGYFQEVLEASSSCNEVTLTKDGGWTPLVQKKEKEPEVKSRKSEVRVETLSDDSDSDGGPTAANDKDDSIIEEVGTKRKATDIEMVTLSDSDDDSPPAKKAAYSSDSGPTSNPGGGSLNQTSKAEGTGSSNGSSLQAVANNGVNRSPASTGSDSPPIICLDSPAASPSPPLRQAVDPLAQVSTTSRITENGSCQNSNNSPSLPSQSPPSSANSPAPVIQSSPSPSLPLSAAASVAASLASLGSELRPVVSPASASVSPHPGTPGPLTITPIPPPTLSPSQAALLTNYASHMQDPSGYQSIASAAAQQYSLQNIFGGQLPMMPPVPGSVPPSSSPQMGGYNRPPDRYM